MTSPYSLWLPAVAGGWGMEPAQGAREGMVPASTLTPPTSCPVVPTPLPPRSPIPPRSVLLLGSAVLGNALGGQLGQYVIQVVGIRVAVAGEVRAELCLVMDLVPDDGV